jgi:hypothetical protein
MAKFYFRNDNAKDIQLIVEPWAIAELVPAGTIVEFEVNDAPPPEIHFGVAEEGQAYIYVMSERVGIDINGERFDYETDERPPSQVFHFFRKDWWGTRDD